jgi:NAD(P)-dependent dehydrogenase (short-subunit alcohol dehydrogenase family)
MSTPEQVAGHVRFPLSEEASFVTGQAYVADGGELVS